MYIPAYFRNNNLPEPRKFIIDNSLVIFSGLLTYPQVGMVISMLLSKNLITEKIIPE